MTKINEDMLSLRVARSGTKRPKYGRFVPAAPQCLLMILAIAHNLIHDNRMFAKRAFYLYTFSGSFAIAYYTFSTTASASLQNKKAQPPYYFHLTPKSPVCKPFPR